MGDKNKEKAVDRHKVLFYVWALYIVNFLFFNVMLGWAVAVLKSCQPCLKHNS